MRARESERPHCYAAIRSSRIDALTSVLKKSFILVDSQSCPSIAYADTAGRQSFLTSTLGPTCRQLLPSPLYHSVSSRFLS